MNVIKVEELLSSKVYVRESSSINFRSPAQYLEPFLEMVQPIAREISVEVNNPVINAEESGKMNIAYPRVKVEARLGNPITGFHSVLGFIYALDTQIPIAKVYSGQSVTACLNLTIFNAEELYEQNLLGNSKEIYNRAMMFKQGKEKQVEEYSKIYKSMTESSLTVEGLNQLLGKLLVRGSRTKLGTSPVVGAAKLLVDPKTMYYVNEGPDFNCSQWNVFNAVTQSLTDSTDPVIRPNKTIELATIIREN